ncbi:MAG: hypothetical protein U1F18_06105 [Steroidobacteraceae bacterium]
MGRAPRDPASARASAQPDLNDDGFPDLFVTNRTYYAAGKRVSPAPGQNRLFVNRGNRNRWIKVRLVGARGNRNAYGAMIKVTQELVQYHETQNAHGYELDQRPGDHLRSRRAHAGRVDRGSLAGWHHPVVVRAAGGHDRGTGRSSALNDG